MPDHECDGCANDPCPAGCDGGCEAVSVDRRRFILDVSRYALAVAAGAGLGDLVVVRRANAQDGPAPMVNSLGMQLVYIPAGKFQMGSDSVADEKPVHEVTISKPFWLAACETSNANYRAFVKATGRPEPGVLVESKKKVKPWQTRMFSADEQPVTCITWDEAVAFCEWLSEREGAKYRLPTEAEWEYAYRAGTQTKYYWGDDPGGRDKVYFAKPWPEETKQAPDYQETSWGLYTTLPVQCEDAAKNPFGLCHMAGNAWEWCSDWYGPYPADPQTDPTGPAEGEKKVTRGGSLFHKSRIATASARRPMAPNTSCHNRGFRVLREA